MKLLAELSARFIRRNEAAEALVTGLVAREHVLLLGPPGVAKSQIVRTLAALIQGAKVFTWLLTKFTTPEELMGPVSLQALEQGRYERVVEGKLPTAHVAFLDEVFKASSAILNSLLTIMEERIFHNDGQPIACPLETLIGASNETPQAEDLGALYDRFVLRCWVPYLEDEQDFRALLKLQVPAPTPIMTIDELHAIQAEAQAIPVPDWAIDALVSTKRALAEEGFYMSDRRWRKSLGLIKAHARVQDRDQVTEDDIIFILGSMAWQDPKDQGKVQGLVAKAVAPTLAEALEVYDSLVEAATQALQTQGAVHERLPTLGQVIEDIKKGRERLKELGQTGRIAELEAKLGELQTKVAAEVQKLIGGGA